MSKIRIYSLISLSLIFFLVSSPVIPFLDRELGQMLISGVAEEEHQNSKDGSKKKLEQSKHFPKSQVRILGHSRFKDSDSRARLYRFSVSEFDMETLDPPPERWV